MINITKHFQGYLWRSDSREPEIFDFDKELDIELDVNTNPFYIEGYLFDKLNNTSYNIKFIDGEYISKVVPLTGKENEEFVEKKYYGERMRGKILVFRQYWKEEADPYCEDFPVLQPSDFLFVGFKN